MHVQQNVLPPDLFEHGILVSMVLTAKLLTTKAVTGKVMCHK
ncbi:MAG: hypothetical protein WDM70_08915 [Nitrosomonadales bacterium]